MAWADLLQSASFRGAVFDCLRTTDRAERAVAQHEYPYLDGADIEDLGRKARRITLRAIFFGERYESALQFFLSVLDDGVQGELIHPVFGAIPQVQLLDYEVEHEAEARDQCQVTLHFVEHTTGQPFFAQNLPITSVAKIPATIAVAQTAMDNTLAGWMAPFALLAGIGNALKRLNELKAALLAPLYRVFSFVRGVKQAGLSLINFPRAFAADLRAALTGLRNCFDFGGSNGDHVPGSSTGIVVRSVSAQLAFAGISPVSSVSPASFSASDALTSPVSASLQRADFAALAAVLIPAHVVRGVELATTVYRTQIATPTNLADALAIVAHVRAEQALTLADAAHIVFEAQTADPALTQLEIESIANTVRTGLQSAIEAYREAFALEVRGPVVEALRDTAHAVQAAARAIVEQRPALVPHQVQALSNVRLLAHQLYQDHGRADEISRLNRLGRKPALERLDQLVIYAT